MFKYISKKTKNVIKSSEGFTLLEVIMAVSILTIGMLAVASLQVTAMRGNTMSMDYTESTEKVQDIIEKLYGKDFDDPDLEDSKPAAGPDGTAGLDKATEATADHHIKSGEYEVYWNVADDTARDSTGWRVAHGVKTIRVIVTWNDKGHPRMYKFDLLRSRI